LSLLTDPARNLPLPKPQARGSGLVPIAVELRAPFPDTALALGGGRRIGGLR